MTRGEKEEGERRKVEGRVENRRGESFAIFLLAVPIFLVSRHVSCALCPAAYYAPLHKAVYVACNPYRAAKDKVTLRNCFPWDEAKLAISSFPSFRSLRSPVFRVSLFFNPPPPRFPRLYHSFLSTSFRRDARRQKATAPQRAKERAGIRLFPHRGTGNTDYFVNTITFSLLLPSLESSSRKGGSNR